jgi:hypothetical protein
LLLAITAIWISLPSPYRLNLEPVAYAATFTVTNSNDDGPGSLRKAIAVSNLNPGASPNLISFSIPGVRVQTTLLSMEGSDAAGPGQVVSAIATDSRGNTSELSPRLAVQDGDLFELIRTRTTVLESAANVTITVSRSGNLTVPASVDYATVDRSAAAGSDYTAVSGTLTFGTGESQKSFAIPIINDSLAEGIEVFQVQLSNPRGGPFLLIRDEDIIIDDDEIPSGIVYAITADNHLVSFNSTRPDALFENRSIVGERVYAIDFRPATGQLYALGVSGQLYTVELSNVTLIPVGTSLLPNFGGFDFNPVTDRIRIANQNGNVEVNPNTGAIVATDTPLVLSPGDPNSGRTTRVLGLAHTNNLAGATSTTTYGIHWTGAFDPTQLVTVGTLGGSPVSPNAGLMFTVGQSPPTQTFAGFDISDSGEAFATLAHPEAGSFATFYKINLTSGSAQGLGIVIGTNSSPIIDIAVQPAEKVQFQSSLFSVNENAGTATITVTRTGLGGFTIVDYATSNGSATAAADYVQTSGELVFSPGEKSKTFPVSILDDSLPEGVETVILSLTVRATDSGGIVGTRATARLAIMDEPTEPLSNRIDNAEFFVHQHYSDFLNREPDAGGLAFWTNHITQCFNDALCIHNRRVGTSAAFFIENEFQQTGFFIYRFYRATLGRQPSFIEFTTDRGKVVGGVNLESGKQLFATEFVQRQGFLQQYPAGQETGTFIDALLVTASQVSGVADLSNRRDNLLAQYNLGANQTDSRTRVVRALIDDGAFSASSTIQRLC